MYVRKGVVIVPFGDEVVTSLSSVDVKVEAMGDTFGDGYIGAQLKVVDVNVYVESRGSVVDVDVMGVIAVECADGKVRPLCGGDVVIILPAARVVVKFHKGAFRELRIDFGWGRGEGLRGRGKYVA